MARINGENKDVTGMTFAAYLQQEGYDLTRVAVECNEQIVPKVQYQTTQIKDTDVIEIVSFVGGG